MKKKVLILSASSGAGHLRAAQALESAFKSRIPESEIIHLDALELLSPVMRNIYSRTYLHMVNRAPSVLGFLYDSADVPWKDEKQRLAFDRLNALPLIKAIEKLAPEQIICTHFLPAEIVSWLLCKGRIRTRHSIVVTDFDLHAMWLCRHFNDYFVALEETAEHLHQLGVPRERTHISGIPIDPVFAIEKDKKETRKRLALEADTPVILLSAGGFGVGPVEQILASLKGLKNRAQLLALCGHNQELLSKLEATAGDLAYSNSNLSLIPIPFTQRMDEYMAAADILLGKPGGLTSSEALSRGLAFAIINPIPGQEERNSDHLLEHGIAIRCNNLPTLAYKLDKLIENKAKLAEMQAKSREYSHPGSSTEIVDYLLSSQAPTIVNSNGTHNCRLDWRPFALSKELEGIEIKAKSKQSRRR